ncbi:MAG: DNA primase [Firmicutes bacterium]|nr:DNA primase [Bacillota bacterium]MDD4791680.1 DNA primase [Bacillota bacterium]
MSSKYSDDLIDKVREANEIISVVSDYVQLKKVGNRFVGLCPFHTERTPSFSVSPDRQLFYCFGCHVGGNVFTFIMKMEGLTFPEAVRRLGQRAGIDVSTDAESPQERAARERRESIYRVNGLALAYYRQILMRAPYAQRARDYLKRRRIESDTQEKFKLGYAPASWDSLLSVLAKKGIQPALAYEAGLASRASGTTRYYDRFRNRLVFPIVNVYDRIVGFGGRALDDSMPKYLNSPESAVFSKRSNLYGINLASDSIRRSGKAVLVEGYMDVISAHQAGQTNVVATLGTALTTEQARVVLRYANQVVLCYDADTAGLDATVRGVNTTTALGLDVRVAVLPEGHDPDSFIGEHGGKAFQTSVDEAVVFTRYQLDRIVAETDWSDLDSRLRAVEKVVGVLAEVDSEIERAEYVRQLSGKLNVDSGALAMDIQKARMSARRTAERPGLGQGLRSVAHAIPSAPNEALEDPVWSSKAYLEVERALIRLATVSSQHRARIVEVIGHDGFKMPAHERLFCLLLDAGGDESVAPAELVDCVDAELKDYASSVMFGAKPWEAQDDALENALEAWQQFSIKHRLNEIDDEIKEADVSGDYERVRELQVEQKQLRRSLGSNVALY